MDRKTEKISIIQRVKGWFQKQIIKIKPSHLTLPLKPHYGYPSLSSTYAQLTKRTRTDSGISQIYSAPRTSPSWSNESPFPGMDMTTNTITNNSNTTTITTTTTTPSNNNMTSSNGISSSHLQSLYIYLCQILSILPLDSLDQDVLDLSKSLSFAKHDFKCPSCLSFTSWTCGIQFIGCSCSLCIECISSYGPQFTFHLEKLMKCPQCGEGVYTSREIEMVCGEEVGTKYAELELEEIQSQLWNCDTETCHNSGWLDEPITNQVICSSCGFKKCGKCGGKHDGLSCEEWEWLKGGKNSNIKSMVRKKF